MATLEELVVRIKADAAQLEREMKKAGAITDQTGKKMGASMDAAGKSIGGLKGQVAALAAVIGGGKIVGAITTFEKIEASLRTVTGSAANAAGAFDMIQKFAATTPYSVEQVAEAFIKLKALGLTPTEEALRSYGNTASAMGKTINEMIEAVADASTGEFERLKEFGIKTKDAGDSVVFTFQGISTTVKKNAAEIEDYLRSIGDVQFGDAMKEQQGTLNAALSNMGDSFMNLAKTIGDAGLTDLLIGITEKIQNLTKVATESIPKFQLGFKKLVGGVIKPFVDPDVAAGIDAEIDAAADKQVASASNKPVYKPTAATRGGGSFGSDKKEKKKKEAEDYDKAGDAMSEYLGQLERERELAAMSGKELEIRRAILEATAIAIKDNNLLGPEMEEQIRAEVGAAYDLKEATDKLKESQEEAARFAQELKDKLSDSLSGIVLDFDNATASAARFAEAIAKTILERKVTGPLSEGLIDMIDTSSIGQSIGGFLGFGGARASGGSVSAGMSYLVGEKGPELFTPGASGNIASNDKLGGVTIVQQNTFGGGVSRAELQSMLPAVAEAAKRGVFNEMQRGGAGSRITGNRG